MVKSKVIRSALVFIVLVFGVLTFAACAPQPAPEAKGDETIPVVTAIPNKGTPRSYVVVYGANYEPDKELRVTNQLARGPAELATEQTMSYQTDGGLFLRTDGLGSFAINGARIPKEEGVWAIRVYDKEGKQLAATLFVCEAKK